MLFTNINIAGNRIKLKQYKKSIESLIQAETIYFEIETEINDINFLTMIYANLGANFKEINQYKQSEVYHHKAVKLAIQANSNSYLINQNIALAELFIAQKKLDLAIEYLRKAEQDQQTHKFFNYNKELMELFYKIYLKQNNTKKSFFICKNYMKFKKNYWQVTMLMQNIL